MRIEKSQPAPVMPTGPTYLEKGSVPISLKPSSQARDHLEVIDEHVEKERKGCLMRCALWIYNLFASLFRCFCRKTKDKEILEEPSKEESKISSSSNELPEEEVEKQSPSLKLPLVENVANSSPDSFLAAASLEPAEDVEEGVLSPPQPAPMENVANSSPDSFPAAASSEPALEEPLQNILPDSFNEALFPVEKASLFCKTFPNPSDLLKVETRSAFSAFVRNGEAGKRLQLWIIYQLALRAKETRAYRQVIKDYVVFAEEIEDYLLKEFKRGPMSLTDDDFSRLPGVLSAQLKSEKFKLQEQEEPMEQLGHYTDPKK